MMKIYLWLLIGFISFFSVTFFDDSMLIVIQFSFGVIPNVRAKGKGAVRVADILNRMQAEEPVNTSNVINLGF